MDKKEVIFVLLNNFADWEGSLYLHLPKYGRQAGMFD